MQFSWGFSVFLCLSFFLARCMDEFSEKSVKLLPLERKLKTCYMIIKGTETKPESMHQYDDIPEMYYNRSMDMAWEKHREKFGLKIDEFIKGPQNGKNWEDFKRSLKFKFLKKIYRYAVTFYKHSDLEDLLIEVEEVF